MSSVLHQLRRTVLMHDGAGLSDGQLLECFLARHEEAAFEALVRRHGPMVRGVCRRLLSNAADADDAFQATFLVLVRKAASVVPRELVGHWLYGVAYRTATKARATAARRRAREKPLFDLPAREAPDESVCHDLRPLLDHELNRLPDKYRAPVVLCHLEGKSRGEAARQLGLPEGTLSSRLARARALLSQRLTRRGLVVSAVALAALSPSVASAAVPAPLMTSTVQAALHVAAGKAAVAGAISAPVAALTRGVLRAMLIHRLKVAMVVLVALGVAGLGTGMLTRQALADKPGEVKKKDSQPAEQGAKEKKEQGPSYHGVVKTVDTGKQTITVTMMGKAGTKQSEEKTFAIAGDAKVFLEDRLTKDQPQTEGKLADLIEGTQVTVQLDVDKKAAVMISARGPGLHGSVKSVNVAGNGLTVATKEKGGPMEHTVTLVKDAKVLLNDGLAKGTEDQQGKLADLTEGTPVQVQLSVDRRSALSVRVLGASVQGSLKSYDAGNKTITVSVKENGAVVDKTFTVVKDAHLSDLTEGQPVALTLSVFDKDKVVAAHGRKPDEE